MIQHDGTVGVIDRVEVGAKSGLLRETMLEKMPTLDVTSSTVDAVVLASSSMRNEVMHEGELMLDGTANTTGAAGLSADMADKVMHGKAAAHEGASDVVDIARETDKSTGLQGEVAASQYQQALNNKEFEKLTVIEEKMDEPAEYDAAQPVKEGLEMDHCEEIAASGETIFAEKAEGPSVFLQPSEEHAGVSKEDVANANLMAREPRAEDKGNGIAFDVLSRKDKDDCVNSVGRGIDSTVQLGTEPVETSKSAVKQENDTIEIA
ncbi:hypothetical protein ACP70R_017156 [Stipagrostis hirtigluma subsp. patula]